MLYVLYYGRSIRKSFKLKESDYDNYEILVEKLAETSGHLLIT